MKASYPIWKVSRVWLKTPRPALGIIDCFTSTRFIDSSIDKNLGGWPAKSSKLLLQWVYKIYTCPVFRLSKKFGFQTLLPRFGNKCPKTGLPGIRFLNKSSFCTITVLFILVSGQIILIKWWSNYQACGDVVGLIRVPKWVVSLKGSSINDVKTSDTKVLPSTSLALRHVWKAPKSNRNLDEVAKYFHC